MGRNSGEDGPEQMNSEPCGVVSSPFISTETYEALGTIEFDGTDQKGNNIKANGIEQCAYNPRDKKFYLNIRRPWSPLGPPPAPARASS
jgi:hypothetical protein